MLATASADKAKELAETIKNPAMRDAALKKVAPSGRKTTRQLNHARRDLFSTERRMREPNRNAAPTEKRRASVKAVPLTACANDRSVRAFAIHPRR